MNFDRAEILLWELQEESENNDGETCDLIDIESIDTNLLEQWRQKQIVELQSWGNMVKSGNKNAGSNSNLDKNAKKKQKKSKNSKLKGILKKD